MKNGAKTNFIERLLFSSPRIYKLKFKLITPWFRVFLKRLSKVDWDISDIYKGYIDGERERERVLC